MIAAGILALAFALRLGHVLSQRGDVLFDHPALDEREYVQNARALADGHGEDRPPAWQPPGLTYVLAATFEVAGPGLLAPRLLHVLVSVASCLLLFLIARRLFDARAALAAMAIAAVHGVLVFERGALAGDLDLVPGICSRCGSRCARRVAAGARCGGGGPRARASATFAPTIAPFVVIVAVMLRRPPLVAALLVAMLFAPIVPITARNLLHGGELVVVIPTNGGLNLHVGNNADYAQTFAMRPGITGRC